MSNNLSNLQNLLNKPGSTATTPGGTLADLLGKGSGNDSQAFAKLMAQYQSPQAIARSVVPGAAASQPHAAAQALRAQSSQQAMVKPAQQPTPHAPEQAHTETQTEQTRQAAKQAQKSGASSGKANNEARAKSRHAEGDTRTAKSDRADKADAKNTDKSDDVKFATEQGEGTAQVRELQPPPDVSTSDPAAMMAWLSSLSQGGEAGAASPGGEAAADGDTGAGTGGADLLGAHGAKPGLGAAAGAGALPTGTAALTAQLMDQQAFKGDAKALAAAESVGVGVNAASAKDAASPLEFNALMARELSRPVGGAAAGPEGAHAAATLPTPVDSPDFKQALAERVGMWVSGTPANGQMTAELRLNPEDMGPVHIRIVMDGQNAQVDFAAAHAETRQAIEASLPALSTALEDAGLSLAGGGVSDQNAGQAWAQQQGQGEGQQRAMAWSGRGLGAEAHGSENLTGPQPVARPAARPGGLDLYA